MSENNQKERTISIRITKEKLKKYFLILLVWTISMAGVWILACKNHQRNDEIASGEIYPLLNPRLRNLSQEERYMHAFPTLIPLREKIFSYLGDRKENVAFYVEDLNSGAWTGHREKDIFYPASLLKVPVAIGIMKKIDSGEWTLEKTISLEEKYRDKRFGNLWKEKDGTKFSVELLLEKMLGESDNTATNMLFGSLTEKEKDDVYYHIGISNPEKINKENGTFFFENISARDLATFFRSLYNATYLTRKSSNHILELLDRVKNDSLISKEIPAEMKISHKMAVFTDIPDHPKNFHDCGIAFFPDHPYLYCIMTENLDDPEAQEIIAGMGGEIYKYFKREDPD